MSTQHRMGLGVAPLFLRATLALVFIWAGLGKIMATMDVQGDMAATLANMGVIKPSTTPTGGGTSTPAPAKPLPAPADSPSTPPADGGKVQSDPANPLEPTIVSVNQDAPPPAGAPAGSSPGVNPAPTSGPYTAADFPNPVPVKTMYLLAASLHTAAHPVATPETPAPKAIWPPALASGRLPIIMAYLVVAAELGGGALILIGLCTRVAAFSIAGVMAGAMWLTQFGPAIQSGKAVYGILPNHAAFGPDWMPLMFQFSLFCAALALMCTGPGYMAADHALFGRRHRHEDHDDE